MRQGLICICMMLLVGACTPKDSPEFGIKKQVVAYEKLPIHRTNLQVINMPDRLRVSIRSDAIFTGFSAKFKHNYRQSLRALEDLLKHRAQPVKIIVNGYQSNIGDQNKLIDLAKAQADAVAAYIWAMGIPSDLIAVHAHGGEGMVSASDTASGNVENRRIDVDIF